MWPWSSQASRISGTVPRRGLSMASPWGARSVSQQAARPLRWPSTTVHVTRSWICGPTGAMHVQPSRMVSTPSSSATRWTAEASMSITASSWRTMRFLMKASVPAFCSSISGSTCSTRLQRSPPGEFVSRSL